MVQKLYVGSLRWRGPLGVYFAESEEEFRRRAKPGDGYLTEAHDCPSAIAEMAQTPEGRAALEAALALGVCVGKKFHDGHADCDNGV